MKEFCPNKKDNKVHYLTVKSNMYNMFLFTVEDSSLLEKKTD